MSTHARADSAGALAELQGPRIVPTFLGWSAARLHCEDRENLIIVYVERHFQDTQLLEETKSCSTLYALTSIDSCAKATFRSVSLQMLREPQVGPGVGVAFKQMIKTSSAAQAGTWVSHMVLLAHMARGHPTHPITFEGLARCEDDFMTRASVGVTHWLQRDLRALGSAVPSDSWPSHSSRSKSCGSLWNSEGLCQKTYASPMPPIPFVS